MGPGWLYTVPAAAAAAAAAAISTMAARSLRRCCCCCCWHVGHGCGQFPLLVVVAVSALQYQTIHYAGTSLGNLRVELACEPRRLIPYSLITVRQQVCLQLPTWQCHQQSTSHDKQQREVPGWVSGRQEGSNLHAAHTHTACCATKFVESACTCLVILGEHDNPPAASLRSPPPIQPVLARQNRHRAQTFVLLQKTHARTHAHTHTCTPTHHTHTAAQCHQANRFEHVMLGLGGCNTSRPVQHNQRKHSTAPAQHMRQKRTHSGCAPALCAYQQHRSQQCFQCCQT
jgi:hypothetical protein